MAENTPATVSPGQLATADQYNTIVGFFNNYGVASYASDPATPNEGQIWFNSTQGRVKASVVAPVITHKTNFTAPTGHNKVHALAYDGTYIYAGYNTSPGVVDQIIPSTMALNKTFTAPTGHNTVHALAYDGTYIYAAYGAGEVVDQIIPSMMILNKTSATLQGNCASLAYDGTYIYAGLSTSPGVVQQIIPSTLAIGITFNMISDYANAIAFLNGRLYAGSGLNQYGPAVVECFDVASGASICLGQTNGNLGHIYAVIPIHDFVFVGGMVNIIIAYDPTTLSILAYRGPNDILGNFGSILSFAFDGTYLYTGLSQSPGIVGQLEIATKQMTRNVA